MIHLLKMKKLRAEEVAQGHIVVRDKPRFKRGLPVPRVHALLNW